MVRRRFEALSPHRLTPDKVRSVLSPDNPEFEHKMTLATVGISVHTSEGFVLNSSLPGAVPLLSKSYLSASPAVNRMVYEQFHETKLAFILKLETALSIPGTQIMPLGWAPKDSTHSGRPTCNGSYSGNRTLPLNTKSVKEECDHQWGRSHHPTVKQFAQLILASVDRELARDPLFDVSLVQIWKMDLKEAFSLLSV